MTTANTIYRIGPADHGRRMGLDRFLDADVMEGPRYELARGVLEVTDLPDDAHFQVVSNLHQAVARHALEHPETILRIGGGGEFRFDLPGAEASWRPDLGVVLRGAPRDWRGRRLPALAAEVVARDSVERDYRTKRQDYLAHGLLEYWIVDPLEGKVTVLTRRGDTWSEAVFRDGRVIVSALLPGFATTAAELWADVEEPDHPAARPPLLHAAPDPRPEGFLTGRDDIDGDDAF